MTEGKSFRLPKSGFTHLKCSPKGQIDHPHLPSSNTQRLQSGSLLSAAIRSFFPHNKAVIHLKCNYVISASIPLLVPSHSDRFFFIFEYGECPNHSKSQNYTKSSQKYQYPPRPNPAPRFPLWEVTNLSTLCFSRPIFLFCKNNYTFAYFLISS